MRERPLFALVICASFASSSPALAGAVFMGLGDLAGGSIGSAANAVSANGRVVVGESDSSMGNEAFRWTVDGGMVGLGDLPGGRFASAAYGVSADGSVVVGESESELTKPWQEAFRWEQGVMTGLGDLPGGPSSSIARDVSYDGSVVVGRSQISSSVQQSFRWDGTMEGIPFVSELGYGWSNATGVSADGDVVVGWSSGVGVYAYRWEDGVSVALGPGPGGAFHRRALDVSADGSVVVGYADLILDGNHDKYEAFLWTQEDGIVGIGKLNSSFTFARSEARAVSADGSIIVGTSHVGISEDVAFIWDQGQGMQNLQDVLSNEFGLDLTGWNLEAVNGISEDGLTIVGTGIDPSGYTQAWLAHIPEPSTASLVALGLVGIAAGRRHANRSRRGIEGTRLPCHQSGLPASAA